MRVQVIMGNTSRQLDRGLRNRNVERSSNYISVYAHYHLARCVHSLDVVKTLEKRLGNAPGSGRLSVKGPESVTLH